MNAPVLNALTEFLILAGTRFIHSIVAFIIFIFDVSTPVALSAPFAPIIDDATAVVPLPIPCQACFA